MKNGWIHLHRKLLDCSLWIDSEPFDRRSAWIDLLLLANHHDKEIVFDGHKMVITRGQYLTSVRKLSERWHWSVNRTLRYLRLLEELGMIHRDSNAKRTLLTVVNYEVYQDTQNTHGDSNEYSDGDTHGDTDEDTDESQYKNIKNDNKNDKELKTYDEDIEKAFQSFKSMREQMKQPLTEETITMLMENLNVLSGGDKDKAIKIINQSVLKGWKGFYPLKEDAPKEKPKKNKFNNYEGRHYTDEQLLELERAFARGNNA